MNSKRRSPKGDMDPAIKAAIITGLFTVAVAFISGAFDSPPQVRVASIPNPAISRFNSNPQINSNAVQNVIGGNGAVVTQSINNSNNSMVMINGNVVQSSR